MWTKKTRLLSIVLFFGIGVCLATKLSNKQYYFINSDFSISEYTKKQFTTEEFGIVEGIWQVSEYLGMAVEVLSSEEVLKENEESREEFTSQIIYNNLGKRLTVKKNNIEMLSPSTELGYRIIDNESLFFIFRQPADLNISPPYICVSIKLKDKEDVFDIIIDADNVPVLHINSCFFGLEKLNE